MTSPGDMFPHDPPTLPGRGWLEPAAANGETFRAMMRDATLRVALAAPREHRIFIELEPAGTSSEPVLLDVIDDAGVSVRFAVAERQTIVFALRPEHPRVGEVRFHVASPGSVAANGAAAPAFRVFRVQVQMTWPDVGGSGARPSRGWCLREEHEGEFFRWAGDEVVLERTSSTSTIELELEPGPGATGLPLRLAAFADDESVLGTFELGGRQRIAIPPAAGDPAPRNVILRTDRPGRVMVGDARVLNYRAFASPSER
jgi:hypothetical protein